MQRPVQPAVGCQPAGMSTSISDQQCFSFTNKRFKIQSIPKCKRASQYRVSGYACCGLPNSSNLNFPESQNSTVSGKLHDQIIYMIAYKPTASDSADRLQVLVGDPV